MLTFFLFIGCPLLVSVFLLGAYGTNKKIDWVLLLVSVEDRQKGKNKKSSPNELTSLHYEKRESLLFENSQEFLKFSHL